MGVEQSTMILVGCLLLLRYLMSFLVDGGGRCEEVLHKGPPATHTHTSLLGLQLPYMDILE